MTSFGILRSQWYPSSRSNSRRPFSLVRLPNSVSRPPSGLFQPAYRPYTFVAGVDLNTHSRRWIIDRSVPASSAASYLLRCATRDVGAFRRKSEYERACVRPLWLSRVPEVCQEPPATRRWRTRAGRTSPTRPFLPAPRLNTPVSSVAPETPYASVDSSRTPPGPPSRTGSVPARRIPADRPLARRPARRTVPRARAAAPGATCGVCQRHFKRAVDLRRHARCHQTTVAAAKPFVCLIGACDLRFSRNDNLTRHAWLVHGHSQLPQTPVVLHGTGTLD